MAELGDFLKSRRARVTPESAGLAHGARRRVPGLRREEVAQLSGISVEYYIRLEQGRSASPSEEVLDAIARVLRLDEVEHAHLTRLARPARRTPRPRPEPVRPELVRLMTLLDRAPALIVNHRWDVLSANHLAGVLFPSDNLARYAFLDPAARAFYDDWDEVTATTVGQLRLSATQFPGDRALATLVGELSMASTEFRTLWAGRDVKQRTHGVKRFHHPLVGELELAYEHLDIAGVPGQKLVTLIPAADTPTEAALTILASWTTAQTLT